MQRGHQEQNSEDFDDKYCTLMWKCLLILYICWAVAVDDPCKPSALLFPVLDHAMRPPAWSTLVFGGLARKRAQLAQVLRTFCVRKDGTVSHNNGQHATVHSGHSLDTRRASISLHIQLVQRA